MAALNFFWFRRDLRLEDNAGLYHALKGDRPVQPVFIFDRNILDKLKAKDDARVTLIYDAIIEMDRQLRGMGSALWVYYGYPLEIWKQLSEAHDIGTLYTNRDYEPYAKQRDEAVEAILTTQGAQLKTFKDHVLFEYDEVLKKDGNPYTVFTPYSKTWKAQLETDMRQVNPPDDGEAYSYFFQSYPTLKYKSNFHQTEPRDIPTLEDMGFMRTDVPIPDTTVPISTIKHYNERRNYPGTGGSTSRLGPHYRFGTVSIREKARKAQRLNATYLNELIWRDFYSQIMTNFPHVVDEPFRGKYDYIEWRNDEAEFEKWCKGETGYPIVDAGMRELNTIGYMHNRVRMITASFLTKHLLIDWRWGEQYFAEKLLDYELASNNGGWQWAAGCGTDAAPYFRVFNPYSQQKKFDKDFTYIKRWVPEYGTDAYPEPMVDHKEARERCLTTYKAGLAKAAEVMA